MTVTSIPLIFVGDIVKTHLGAELYHVDKVNPKNLRMTSLKTGKVYTLDQRGAVKVEHTMTDEEKAKVFPETTLSADEVSRMRVGAVVTATSTNRKWNYSSDQKFVVLSISDKTAKITKLGGDIQGMVWRLPVSSLTFLDPNNF